MWSPDSLDRYGFIVSSLWKQSDKYLYLIPFVFCKLNWGKILSIVFRIIF